MDDPKDLVLGEYFIVFSDDGNHFVSPSSPHLQFFIFLELVIFVGIGIIHSFTCDHVDGLVVLLTKVKTLKAVFMWEKFNNASGGMASEDKAMGTIICDAIHFVDGMK